MQMSAQAIIIKKRRLLKNSKPVDNVKTHNSILTQERSKSCPNLPISNTSTATTTTKRTEYARCPRNKGFLKPYKSEPNITSLRLLIRTYQRRHFNKKATTNKYSMSSSPQNNKNHRMSNRNSGNQSGTANTSMSSASRNSSQATTPTGTLNSRGFADLSSIRIPIVGFEVMEERARFTVYKLRIENPFTHECWLVLRRYTDFVRLHKKLKSLPASNNNIQLNLPRKNLFGNNFGNAFLEQRAHGLQQFVNTIMANETIRNTQAVKDFFCLDEPPAYSDSLEECRAMFEAQEETICHLKLQLQSRDDQIRLLQQQLEASMLDQGKNCLKCATQVVTTAVMDPVTTQERLDNYANGNSDVNSNNTTQV